MFEAFEKGGALTDASGGVGLGLAIVQRLAELAGVKVKVTSKSGEGAAFEVGPFRLAPLNAETATAVTPAIAPLPDRTGSALIIDDDSATLEATGSLLASWGWDVDLRDRLSTDEIETLQEPDLIICDYDLRRNWTGLEIIDALRERFGDTPALIMTGSSSPETAERIRQAGLLVLLKPVRSVQLRSALISLVG